MIRVLLGVGAAVILLLAGAIFLEALIVWATYNACAPTGWVPIGYFQWVLGIIGLHVVLGIVQR